MKRLFLVVLGIAALVMVGAATASAGECTSGLCGTPQQSGGGCGCGCGGSILVNMTDRGLTYQFADDFDGDGIEDEYDNCPFKANVDQLDSDGDGVGDACDLCPNVYDPQQGDLNGNGIGDSCDPDKDGDNVPNGSDNCPAVYNPNQRDSDGNGVGDACDPAFRSACQANPNAPGCAEDEDQDGVPASIDNCPTVYNPDQKNTNLAEELAKQAEAAAKGEPIPPLLGDACDPDIDGDGKFNYEDNCPTVPNADQVDVDMDGKGDNGCWGTDASGQPCTASCDTDECYYASAEDRANDKDGTKCLAANGAFSIALAAAPVKGSTKAFVVGDSVRVTLISNRPHLLQPHSWTARLTEQPGSSSTVVENAKGSAMTLPLSAQVASCLKQNDEGKCIDDNSIRFKPDQPGRYTLVVSATIQSDPLQLQQTTARSTLTVDVGGEGSTGCAAVGGTGALLAGILAGAGLLLRRRKQV